MARILRRNAPDPETESSRRPNDIFRGPLQIILDEVGAGRMNARVSVDTSGCFAGIALLCCGCLKCWTRVQPEIKLYAENSLSIAEFAKSTTDEHSRLHAE